MEIKVEAVSGDTREHRIVAHNGPDLVFRGFEAVRVSNTSGPSKETYHLYLTFGAQYIAVKSAPWNAIFDDPKNTAVVLKDAEAVIDFFGHSPLAKKLYEEAGIDDVTRVA